MNRYKCIKFKGNNWIGLFQTSLNWRNVFILYWCFIHTSLHPDTRFGFSILNFVLPIIERSRSLLGVHFYTWDKSKAGYLSIKLLYLPGLNFRIGNKKTWFWLRNENIYAYKCRRNNQKQYEKYFAK